VLQKTRRRPHEHGPSIPEKPPVLRDLKANQAALLGSRGKRLERLPVPRSARRRTAREEERHVSSRSFHERGRGRAANASRASAAMCSRQDMMSNHEVTFKDFQRLMTKRRRSVDDLVDIFRGKLDDSRSFFERVMSCQWRNPDTGRFEDRSDVVIPYESVIEFYFKETQYLKDTKEEQERLALKRKRGPVNEERRETLRRHLEKARAAKVRDNQKSTPGTREIVEEVM
jgi:hypothetical protein